MNWNTILWDLDGTLLDTLADLHAAVNVVLARFSHPAQTMEQTRRAVGSGVRVLFERSLPGGASDPDLEAAVAAFRDYYGTHNRIKTAPYPGIPELLKSLHRQGVAMAVVSNKPDAAAKALVQSFFGDTIQVCLGQRDGMARKPAPDMVLAALAELHGDSAVYIGDSEVDIATARAAGLPCISVGWGFRSRAELLAAGASRLADSPQALQQLLCCHQ